MGIKKGGVGGVSTHTVKFAGPEAVTGSLKAITTSSKRTGHVPLVTDILYV
jgi:hypothetical protein